MRKKISLPVIESLSVNNYSLYRGKDQEGLKISFDDGVTVIAGVNGVGKTTLLTLLLRLILGPSDPEKPTRNIGRVSKRRLVALNKYDYFSKRVPENLDDKAYAELQFSIGRVGIKVSRFMKNMLIKEVKINNKKYSFKNEVEFIEKLSEMAGFSCGYDFHMAVRYLQFFNEDRLPLLWEPSAQFEFFKILFLEEETAYLLNSAYAQIQRVDTDYRNRTNQLNKRKEALPAKRESSDLEVEALDSMILAAEECYEKEDRFFIAQKAKLDLLQRDRQELNAQMDEAETLFEELEKEYVIEDAQFILQVLPSLEDKAKFLIQGLAGSGCFVCGARAQKQLVSISKKVRKGRCFVCDAKVSKASALSSPSTQLSGLKEIEERMQEVEINLGYFAERELELESEIEKILPIVRKAVNDRMTALQRLDDLILQRPTESTSRTSDLQKEIVREQAELQLLSEKRRKLTADYRAAVDNAQVQISTLKEELRSGLEAYAKAFLQEDIYVVFNRQTPFKLATGADRVNIPSFTIKMTSSTHKVAHERLSSESVSESQKEFLDLAFRMTLLDMINDKESAMLVIETPEASLDSWFMHRAANLIRSFAPEIQENGRKIIASSNINGTLMIPALLGLVDNRGEVAKLEKRRENHLVNLLDFTPPTAAFGQSDAQSILIGELEKIVND